MPLPASQTRAVASSEAVTTRRPSGLKAAPSSLRAWPFMTASGLPPAASHTRAVLSSEAVTTRVPSALNATLRTAPVWPFRSTTSRPSAASHRRAVPSSDAVAIRVPSGLKAASQHRAGVSLQHGDLPAADSVPEAGRAVRRRRHDRPGVRTERGAPHRAGMPLQEGDLLAVGGVPQTRGAVGGRRHHPLAVGAERRAQHRAAVTHEHGPLAQPAQGIVQNGGGARIEGTPWLDAGLGQSLQRQQHGLGVVLRLDGLARPGRQDAGLGQIHLVEPRLGALLLLLGLGQRGVDAVGRRLGLPLRHDRLLSCGFPLRALLEGLQRPPAGDDDGDRQRREEGDTEPLPAAGGVLRDPERRGLLGLGQGNGLDLLALGPDAGLVLPLARPDEIELQSAGLRHVLGPLRHPGPRLGKVAARQQPAGPPAARLPMGRPLGEPGVRAQPVDVGVEDLHQPPQAGAEAAARHAWLGIEQDGAKIAQAARRERAVERTADDRDDALGQPSSLLDLPRANLGEGRGRREREHHRLGLADQGAEARLPKLSAQAALTVQLGSEAVSLQCTAQLVGEVEVVPAVGDVDAQLGVGPGALARGARVHGARIHVRRCRIGRFAPRGHRAPRALPPCSQAEIMSRLTRVVRAGTSIQTLRAVVKVGIGRLVRCRLLVVLAREGARAYTRLARRRLMGVAARRAGMPIRHGLVRRNTLGTPAGQIRPDKSDDAADPSGTTAGAQACSSASDKPAATVSNTAKVNGTSPPPPHSTSHARFSGLPRRKNPCRRPMFQ